MIERSGSVKEAFFKKNAFCNCKNVKNVAKIVIVNASSQGVGSRAENYVPIKIFSHCAESTQPFFFPPFGRCQQLTPPENVVLGDHFHTSEQHVIFAFLLAYIHARSFKKTLRKLDSIRSLLYEQLRRRPKHRFSQNYTLHTMHTQKHARTAQNTIFSPARKSRPRA